MEPPFLYPDIEETFPFQIELPQTFPGSFTESHTAEIKYTIKAIVDIPHASDIKHGNIKCCCSCFGKSGPVTVKLEIRKTGFIPGELIDFILEIHTKSGREPKNVCVELKKTNCMLDHYLNLQMEKRFLEPLS